MGISIRGISLVACLTTVSGCASIVSNSDYPVTFTSLPEGAEVTVRNESGLVIHKATTPTTVTLSAGDGFFDAASYEVEYTKDGYEIGHAKLNAGMDGWYIGNLIFGGLLGMLIVDPATGAMWRLDEVASTQMEQVQPPLAVAEPVESELALKLEELKTLHEQGLITPEEYEARKGELLHAL